MLYRKHLNALTELNTDQMLLQQVAPLRSQVWCVNVNEFITVTFSIHLKFLHRLQEESKQEINVVSNFVLTENVTLSTIIIIEVKLYKEKAKCYICVFLNSFVEFLDTIMKVFLGSDKAFPYIILKSQAIPPQTTSVVSPDLMMLCDFLAFFLKEKCQGSAL